MPIFKATEQQLNDMGANVFRNAEQHFNDNHITGDFLIWMMEKTF